MPKRYALFIAIVILAVAYPLAHVGLGNLRDRDLATPTETPPVMGYNVHDQPNIQGNQVNEPAIPPMQQFGWKLPDAGEPLSDQLPQLVQAAASGSSEASCLLTFISLQCTQRKRLQSSEDQIVNAIVTGGADVDVLLNLAARVQLGSEGTDVGCDSLDPKTLPKINELFRASLENLTPRQKTILALLRSDGSIRRIDASEFFVESGAYVIPQVLAENAERFLHAGFDNHEPLALDGLILVHAPSTAFMPLSTSLWLPNPRLFAQYVLTKRAIFGGESLDDAVSELLDRVLVEMPIEEQEEAQLRASLDAQSWLSADAHSPKLPVKFAAGDVCSP